MSKENPDWDQDVEVEGVTYHVHFDQKQGYVDAIDCPRHPGETADMVSEITIHEINDEDDYPLPEGTDVQALRAKILVIMKHMVPECHECHVEDEANAI